jgi:hypothetical protein
MQTWPGLGDRKRHGITPVENRFQRAPPRGRYLALGSFWLLGLLVVVHQEAVACYAGINQTHPPTQAQASTRSWPSVTPWQPGAMPSIAPFTTVRQPSCLNGQVPAPARPPSRAPRIRKSLGPVSVLGLRPKTASAPALRAWGTTYSSRFSGFGTTKRGIMTRGQLARFAVFATISRRCGHT